MLIKDEQLALKQLEHISYYRLKGYWWGLQSDKVEHKFHPNTYFEEVIKRYEFDKELRLLLFEAIEVIEISLRAKLINVLSLAYGGLWYRNDSLFDKLDLQQNLNTFLRAELFRSSEVFARKYRKDYGILDEKGYCIDLRCEPDAWVIFEVASFGTLSKIYKNLKHQLPEKSQIAHSFGLNNHSDLSSWLEGISYLRNIVAHHARIFERNVAKSLSIPRNPQSPWLSTPLSEAQRKKVYPLISAILYLYNQIDPNNELKVSIKELFIRYPNYAHKIGFMQAWQNEPIWR